MGKRKRDCAAPRIMVFGKSIKNIGGEENTGGKRGGETGTTIALSSQIEKEEEQRAGLSPTAKKSPT